MPGRRLKTKKREQVEVKVSNLHENILDELKKEYGVDKDEDSDDFQPDEDSSKDNNNK